MTYVRTYNFRLFAKTVNVYSGTLYTYGLILCLLAIKAQSPPMKFPLYSLKNKFPFTREFSIRQSRSRQINCATKNKNPTPVFFTTQPQPKVIFILLFRKQYSFQYYCFKNSTLFTINLLTTVIFLFSRLLFLLF